MTAPPRDGRPAAAPRCTVITGVSQGLGAAIFDELYAAGDRLVALGRRFTPAQQRRQQAAPHRVVLRRTDLADHATLPGDRELADLVRAAPQLALIHNAAVIEPLGAIGTLPAPQLARCVAVNLTAPMLLTNSLLAAIDAWHRLTVLFISSSAAHRVGRGRSPYSATKRGGEGFFDGLAAQYQGDDRVRVANVDPGIMDTAMQAVIREQIRAGADLAGRQRHLGLYERGELPSPGAVAHRIVTEHLPTDDGS
jgi:NAD(P)-dependent dehydrogenase (short-subunit alcohol dehydrogenase family)